MLSHMSLSVKCKIGAILVCPGINSPSSFSVKYVSSFLAYRILNCGMRTITRDIKYFQKLGIHIPLRGQQKDIGPTLTHKVQIVNWYIKRMQPSEITKRTYHSLEAVERYILNFAKVSYLSFHYREKLSPSEIAFLVVSLKGW